MTELKKLSITDTDLIVEFIREWVSNQTNHFGIMIPADDWEGYDLKGLWNFFKSLEAMKPEPTGDVAELLKQVGALIHYDAGNPDIDTYVEHTQMFTNLRQAVAALQSELAEWNQWVSEAKCPKCGAISEYQHYSRVYFDSTPESPSSACTPAEGKCDRCGFEWMETASEIEETHWNMTEIAALQSRLSLYECKELPELKAEIAALQQQIKAMQETTSGEFTALQTSEAEWRGLCKGMVMPMEYMGMADDGWRHWECKFCTRSISSKTREVLKAQYCTNPECPAVIARARLEERP